MNVVIFANGEAAVGDWMLPLVTQSTAVIAADGGTRHLRALGLWPDVVIGDMDSLEQGTMGDLRAHGVEIVEHPVMKDETDLELALRYAASMYETDIVVIGALGGRLDQLLANVFLLSAPFLRGRKVRIVEAQQQAWIMETGNNRISGQVKDQVSLLPLGGDVLIGRTEGLAWPLQEEKLLRGMSRGISNRMTAAEANVEVKSGTLLCVHLTREWGR